MVGNMLDDSWSFIIGFSWSVLSKTKWDFDRSCRNVNITNVCFVKWAVEYKQGMMTERENFNICNEVCVDICCTLQSERCAKFSVSWKCVLKCVGKYKVGHVKA